EALGSRRSKMRCGGTTFQHLIHKRRLIFLETREGNHKALDRRSSVESVHQGKDSAGINASAQLAAYRNIAPEVKSHTLLKCRREHFRSFTDMRHVCRDPDRVPEGNGLRCLQRIDVDLHIGP